MGTRLSTLPDWARWGAGAQITPFTLGVEEEVMLLNRGTWGLAQAVDDVLPRLPAKVAHQVHPETHAAVAELATEVHRSVRDVTDELASLRRMLRNTTGPLGLAVACAGTHPFAVWGDTAVSGAERYQLLYGSMRELARREPTFALHVHVGVDDPEDAVTVTNRMRTHVPVLLALSANSPFWQGRDTGLASARTPLFQAFPRVGIPRAFADYEDYVRSIDLLIRLEAFADPTFLWWDVRPQPRLGTVEVRVMDAQTTLAATAALVALVQCLVARQLREGPMDTHAETPELLIENRFLAARDGVDARLIDPVREARLPLAELVEELLEACADHAEDLGCSQELLSVRELLADPGARRQLEGARGPDRLPGLVASLAADFA